MPILTIPSTGVSPKVIPQGGASDAEVLIAQQILGSDAASITFSSIPQTFKDLVIVYTGRSAGSTSGADNLNAQFGHGSVDTGGNYGNFTNFNGTSSGNVNEANATRALIGLLQYSNESAGYFGSGYAEIIDYTDTTTSKQFWVHTAFYGVSVAAYYLLGGGTWKNLTQAIDIIKFYTLSGNNLKAGTKVALYGRG